MLAIKSNINSTSTILQVRLTNEFLMNIDMFVLTKWASSSKQHANEPSEVRVRFYYCWLSFNLVVQQTSMLLINCLLPPKQ